jgi:hypothetical protein
LSSFFGLPRFEVAEQVDADEQEGNYPSDSLLGFEKWIPKN